MEFILKGITDLSGVQATGLTPTVISFKYKISGDNIGSPVISEIGTSGIYKASGITINSEAYLIINAGINGVSGNPYYQYLIKPKFEIDVQYIFIDNKLKLQSVLYNEEVAVAVTDCDAIIYDEENIEISTSTGINNGANFYNINFTSDLVVNDNSRVEITMIYLSVEFKKIVLLPTQLIRI